MGDDDAKLEQLERFTSLRRQKLMSLREPDGLYRPLRRQDFIFEGDVCCDKCGLPIPQAFEFLFTCEKHPQEGWCFSLEQQIATARLEVGVLDKLLEARARKPPLVEVQDLGSGHCTHGIVFDEEAAKTMSVKEIRKRFPRGYFTDPCPDCGYKGIYYASHTHYVAGDW